MEKEKVLSILGKRVIVVAKERLEEISASFVENKYTTISGGWYGSSGISGSSGTSGTSHKSSDDKFALTLRKVPLIVFDDYLIQEITEDCVFIRGVKLSGNYRETSEPGYGVWYAVENFFDAFNILRVLDYKGK